MRRKWLSVAGIGLMLLCGSSEAAAQIKTLEIFEGSVGCRSGLKVDGTGSMLGIDVWLTDPDGTVVHSESDFSYSINLRVEFAVEPSMSGVYTCWSNYSIDSNNLGPPLTQSKQIYLVPQNETTVTGSWLPQNGSVHAFVSTLHGGNFAGRIVKEATGSGGGPDNCHFPGSQVAKQESISQPYTWTVSGSNTFDDAVGWPGNLVLYYRIAGPNMPCETTIVQDMFITRPGQSDYKYKTNILMMGMGTTTVWSLRDGVYIDRTWP